MFKMTSIPRPSEFEIVNDEECIQAAETLYNIENQIKELTKEKNIHRNKLKGRLPENKDALRVGKYKFKRALRKGNIDYKNIPELKEVDLEIYRKPDISSYQLEKVDN